MPVAGTLASHSSRLMNQRRAGMLREGRRWHDDLIVFVIPEIALPEEDRIGAPAGESPDIMIIRPDVRIGNHPLEFGDPGSRRPA